MVSLHSSRLVTMAYHESAASIQIGLLVSLFCYPNSDLLFIFFLKNPTLFYVYGSMGHTYVVPTGARRGRRILLGLASQMFVNLAGYRTQILWKSKKNS